MFNNRQIENIPKILGLKYEWTYSNKGASSILVENVIEYKPFSYWLIDKRTGEKFHTDTVKKFKKFCEELSPN